MSKKTVIIFSLVLLVSFSAQSQVQMKKEVQLQVQTPAVSGINLEEGEKLLVIHAASFQFESPAAVTGDFVYYVKRYLEIQSSNVPLMDFVAPIDLPQGSRIKRVGICFSDSTMKSAVRLDLMHYDPIHPERNRGVVAKVKSYQTKDARTFAIAKSGSVQDVVVDIHQGYYYLTLRLQKHNVYCRFAYAYVIYE